MSVEGVAVVTGGASGIGLACCQELARQGATVVVVNRKPEPAKSVARELGGHAYIGDVSDETGLEACAAAIEKEVGPVDILVNSAGVLQPPARPHALAMETWDDVMRIDGRGTYVACLAFAKAMIARRRGSIVNIASITGLRSVPLHAYGPAKAAVIAMTECLAAEWGPAGVRVNTVSPGYTRTPAMQEQIARGERDISNLERNAALGRTVEPDEIARVVAFLVSPAASGVTGANVPVDCGWLVATPWHTYGGLRDPEA